MDKNKIFESLCSYDKRNPYYDADYDCEREPRTDCYCANCFYSRDILALEILKLLEDQNEN